MWQQALLDKIGKPIRHRILASNNQVLPVLSSRPQYHDAMSKAIALVKAARPRCRALAFVSFWPTPVSVQSRFPNGFPLRWSAPRLSQPPVLLRLLPPRFFTRETWAGAPRAGPPWSGLPLPTAAPRRGAHPAQGVSLPGYPEPLTPALRNILHPA